MRLNEVRAMVRSSVDFFPMSDGDHKHDQQVIFDGVEDSIVALSETVLFKARELLGLGWAGIVGQRFYGQDDSLKVFLGDGRKVFLDASLEFDPIFSHFVSAPLGRIRTKWWVRVLFLRKSPDRRDPRGEPWTQLR